MMALLAKSNGETLYEHSILTYNNGMKIIDMLPYSKEEREKLKSLSSLPLLLHDIGKGATGFQNALKNSANWGGRRHEILSTVFLKNFNLKDEQLFSVITHHKDILYSSSGNALPENQIDQLYGDTEELIDMKKQFEDNEQELQELVKQLFKYINADYKFDIRLGEGIGIEEFWLDGSYGSMYGQKAKYNVEQRKIASHLRAIVKAADHISSAHHELIDQINMKNLSITKYDLRQFQIKCAESNNDIMLVAPTGSGKTEALLLWAKNNQVENARLFYVLPYQASINAMHKRLSEVFGQDYVGVLHSNAISYLYSLQGTDESLKFNYQTRSQNMAALAHEIYYPVRVCTPHQLLRFGLKGKGWEYLFLEFSNGLLIYDEIHAFQPRIAGLTLATAYLLKKLGAKIAFASATFPEFLKKLIRDKLGDIEEIVPDSKYESDRLILNRKRHNVKVLDGTLFDNIELIKNEIINGKYVLVIANHVKTAQRLYEELKSFKPMLLHSRFNKRDRRNKENKLMSDSRPRVVISTQVIEVSLDIDYEVMFSEPAPIDALSQRFGRVNRKGARDPENIYVTRSQMSKHNLYSKERVERTIDLLNIIINPVGELDLVNITNEVYKEGYTEEEMAEFNLGFNNEEILDFEKNLIAGISRDWVSEIVDKYDGNCEVLPIEYVSEYDRLMEQGLWVEAKDLLVNVSYNLVREYASKKDDILLVNCRYSPEIGLLIDEKPSNFDWD